jgi:hypothetical protein
MKRETERLESLDQIDPTGLLSCLPHPNGLLLVELKDTICLMFEDKLHSATVARHRLATKSPPNGNDLQCCRCTRSRSRAPTSTPPYEDILGCQEISGSHPY